MQPPTEGDKSDLDAAVKQSGDLLDEAAQDGDDSISSILSSFQSDTNVNAGNACLDDKSFSVYGHSFDIPFSRICPAFQVFRALVILFAYYFAAGIIFRAFNG